MGGKGSGRKKKPLEAVVEQLRDDIRTLDRARFTIVHRFDMRLEYCLKKIKEE